jgi:hypothetical protein
VLLRGAANRQFVHAAGYLPVVAGDAAPGTTFEAAFVVDGVPSTLRTQPWNGRLTIAVPPRQVNVGEALFFSSAVSADDQPAHLALPPAPALNELSWSSGALGPICCLDVFANDPPGPTHVTVLVDGVPVASGTTEAH